MTAGGGWRNRLFRWILYEIGFEIGSSGSDMPDGWGQDALPNPNEMVCDNV